MPQVTLGKSNSVMIDTMIQSSSPDGNYQGSTTMIVGKYGVGVISRALLYFDLGLIPNDVIINAAQLNLYKESGSAININIHHLTEKLDTSTTWNSQKSFEATPVASFSTSETNGALSVDIKDVVQSWVNGSKANNGILLKAADEATTATSSFRSNESSIQSNLPTLTIDYTIPSTGKKCVEYVGTSAFAIATNATSITAHLPTGFQQGDLLIAHVVTSGASATLTAPSGWTKIGEEDTGNGGIRSAIYYKFAAASETSPRFTSSSNIHWNIGISAYRNVKSVKETVGAWASGTQVSPGAITVTATRTLMVLFTSGLNTNSSTPPLSYAELYDSFYGSGGLLAGSSQRYMYDKTTQSNSENITVFSGNTRVTSRAVALEPFANNSPTLALTSPTDNQTLSEGNTLPVEGTAGDTDNGNVVTVKYKINNGPTRAIASGVSDGSSPISFARTLTYSNKRLWDGSTDIVGADLAEGVDHTLTVWAEDDQGGKSAEVTRKFRVIWNRPPSISGANEDLGTIMVPPSKAYTVTEPEGNPFTITEKINGNVIRSFEGVAGREETVTIPHDLWIRLDLDTPHSLTVEATDSKGLTSTRTFTFTRKETHIEFMLDFDNPDVEAHFTLDGMPKRVLVTLERYLPPGSSVEFVRVCNNAMDQTPTWEDATVAVTAGRGYLFTNQEKTAENWRINIWVCIAKGTATERVRLDGYGGAFD
jgi:hypothetical protein